MPVHFHSAICTADPTRYNCNLVPPITLTLAITNYDSQCLPNYLCQAMPGRDN